MTNSDKSVVDLREGSGTTSNTPSQLQHTEHVDAVKTVKKTGFNKNYPARFFQVCEMTFAIHNITSDVSKFRYLMTSLDFETIDLIDDIIDNPPLPVNMKLQRNGFWTC